MFKNLKKLIPTIILILVSVIISILLLNFFNININDNKNLKLSRSAVFEGLENNESQNLIGGNETFNYTITIDDSIDNCDQNCINQRAKNIVKLKTAIGEEISNGKNEKQGVMITQSDAQEASLND